MTRLDPAFAAARGRTRLIPYLTAGYPSLEESLELMRGFTRAGAIAIEVGMPFSDPIADGAEIQRASEWAVRNGVGVPEVLDLVAAFRRESAVPVVVMTYANPIVHFGAGSFADAAVAAGVDGVLISDLPPDESPDLWRAMDAVALDTVTLVAPTTPAARLPAIVARCRGFVYCLARMGVTGRSAGESAALPERIAELRALTRLPIAVGFGISTPAAARALKGQVAAVVVGAAFMRAVAQDPAHGVADRVAALALELAAALD